MLKIWRRARSVSPFASNVALSIGANIGIALSGLITGPICARLLGPAGRGQLAAMQNLFWLVGVLAMLGMPEATLYFTAKRRSEGGRILASAIALVLLFSPLFFLLSYFAAPVLLAAQSASVITATRWFLLAIPVFAICHIPLSTLRGRDEIAAWNLFRLLPTVGWFLALAWISIFFVPTPNAVAIGYVTALFLAIIPISLAIRRRVSDFRPERKLWRSMLRYGGPVALASVPFTLNLRLDQVLMAALLTPRELGLYVVGVSWSGAVPPILLGIGTVLFPRLAQAGAAQRGGLFAQGTRVSLFLAVMLSALIAPLTPKAIPFLFGKAFAGSIGVAVLLVFSAAILGMNMVFEEGLRGMGETKIVLYGELAGLLVTVTALALLLRPLGIMGAGIASILGYSATAGVLLGRICRSTGHSPVEILLIKREDLHLVGAKVRAVWARPLEVHGEGRA